MAMSRSVGSKSGGGVTTPIQMAPAPIMFATLLVGFFYSYDALYGERRDRSVLFWKSLPVSDRTTVLSKATIPIVVLPAIALVLSFAAVIILIPITAAVMLSNGMSAAAVRAEVPNPLVMIYGMSVHALWFAPIPGWLLLVSAGARRAPLQWAVLPPLMIAGFERLSFRTS
jgi:ABC-2 type transport system permease protein